MSTPIERAIELCGLSGLAHQIGATPNQVNNWKSRGVPVEFCRAIESATSKKVTRKELCPDDWERIWPELADKATQ